MQAPNPALINILPVNPLHVGVGADDKSELSNFVNIF